MTGEEQPASSQCLRDTRESSCICRSAQWLLSCLHIRSYTSTTNPFPLTRANPCSRRRRPDVTAACNNAPVQQVRRPCSFPYHPPSTPTAGGLLALTRATLLAPSVWLLFLIMRCCAAAPDRTDRGLLQEAHSASALVCADCGLVPSKHHQLSPLDTRGLGCICFSAQ